MNTAFERTEQKDEWLTPPEIIQSLGTFDLDPCSPVNRPWDTANLHYTIEDDGLSKDWSGRVWCNPPYGTETGKWLKKLSDHNNGICLIFARTETSNFFNYVWNKASGIRFIKGRLKFYSVDGKQAKNCAGAPSCLVRGATVLRPGPAARVRLQSPRGDPILYQSRGARSDVCDLLVGRCLRVRAPRERWNGFSKWRQGVRSLTKSSITQSSGTILATRVYRSGRCPIRSHPARKQIKPRLCLLASDARGREEISK